jgi:signal peptidase II
MSIVFFVIAGFIVWFDQFTKHAIATRFMPGQSTTVIPHLVWLTYVQNPAGAFGFFGTHPLLLALAAFAVVLVFYYWYRQDGATLLTHVAFGMIIGGAIGNIIDRLRFHYVIDFIDVHTTIHGKLLQWPVFNVADSAISVGVGLLLLRILLLERKQHAAESSSQSPLAAQTPVSAPSSAERSPAEP